LPFGTGAEGVSWVFGSFLDCFFWTGAASFFSAFPFFFFNPD
jgi:hypothetical protein